MASDDEISEAGRQARFAQWEKYGADRLKSDLENDPHSRVGSKAVQDLAWEFVRTKGVEGAHAATAADQPRKVPTYTPEAAKAVYAAIEGLVSNGKRAYSLSVPLEAEKALVRESAGRINPADANQQVRAAINGLVDEGKIEAHLEPYKDWLIREPSKTETPTMATNPAKIFIVHGHDDGTRETVARFVERLGFEAIILHERANKGRTIITKFREEADDVGFAVVLMTADDLGKARDAADLKPRARQNVVFELGFFIGRLGPDRVAALLRGNLERPSDFDGVVYISLDSADWQVKLGQELKAAGYDVDFNRIMGR